MELQIRLATRGDITALMPLVEAAIDENQRAFISAAQIESSRAVMGIDTQLIDDGTYFVVEIDGEVAGCGGWSRRATPYGSDHSAGRDDSLLDPATDAAKVRAMYTHPAYTRRGVGRLILHACEQAAAAEGFSTLELSATLSGYPLYTAYGFVEFDRFFVTEGGDPVPAVRMRKPVEL